MRRLWLAVLVRLALAGRLLARPQRAATMVEYAIVVALIAIVAMGAVQALGGGIAHVFQTILGHVQGAG
ncbi:MAG: Flp family type IVb pilin [Chloroflexota bacterium]